MQEICRALDESVELGMEDVPIVRKCNLRINAVRVKIEVKRSLIKGVEENNPIILEKAIRDAKGICRDLDLPNFCLEEISAGVLKMKRLEAEKVEHAKLVEVLNLETERFSQGKPTLTNPAVSESVRVFFFICFFFLFIFFFILFSFFFKIKHCLTSSFQLAYLIFFL